MNTDVLSLYAAALTQPTDYRIVCALAAAAHAFDVPADMLERDTREQPAATARHVACWLVHDVYHYTDDTIARDLGFVRRLVTYARQHVEDMVATDQDARDRIARARATLLQLDPQAHITPDYNE